MPGEPKGFTLVELLAVLVIASIIAAAVVLRLAGPMRSAQMRGVLGEIAAFDRLTRTEAVENDRAMTLVIDLDAGAFRRRGPGGDERGVAPLSLPSGFRIARAWLPDRELSVGRAAVTCSRLGLTPSYAVLIEGPGREYRCVLVCGLTGEVVEVKDEKEIREVLGETARRHDAG